MEGGRKEEKKEIKGDMRSWRKKNNNEEIAEERMRESDGGRKL